jgi:5-methylcytosine-specific restriction endonuclease McrA
MGALEVDHKIPHKGNLELFWNRNNWQVLCGACHARKTATEDGGFGRPAVDRNIGKHQPFEYDPTP